MRGQTSLGAELRRLREEAKLSPLQLGKALALTSTHVKKNESGAAVPSAAMVRRIADVLQVDPAPLLDLREAAYQRRREGQAAKRARIASQCEDEMPSDARLQLGHYLSRLRNLKGWSSNELARRSEVVATYIHAIERAEVYPAEDRLAPLAKALGADLALMCALSERGRQAKAAATARRAVLRAGLGGLGHAQ